MKHREINILAILFGTLLTVTACQKIDADDIANADGDKKASASESVEEKENSGSNSDDGTLSISSDKHIIAYEYDDNDHHIVYVSLNEWNNIPSALGNADNTKAIDIAAHYNEGGISGWHIPTRAEARYICNRYNRTYSESGVYDDALETLNNNIETAGGKRLTVWYNKDSKPAYRYLCEDATYSYSLKTGSNITKCGTVTKYNLRLIKDSIITK